MIGLGLVLTIGLLLPGGAFGEIKPGTKRAITAGEAVTAKGVILSRDGEMFILRDMSVSDTTVLLTGTTKIRTEQKGLFRGHKPFDVTALLPGLILKKVEGKGDAQGRLVAEDITFTEADLKAAITAYGQTAPLDKEIAETGNRISALDDYDVVKTVAVHFEVSSATLGAEQKAQLDDLASKAPGAKNYTIEVKGFADPVGDAEKNLELSQRRADAVVQYLAVKHNIPLRRIMVPMGYGETQATAEAMTEEARKQARRVEVSVLVNKGLSQQQ